ncbi:MAG: type II secretion system F family protein [Planctomycetes bacterium]|nr:type II secretion system F family protein [Planctomycetota bacterium]
MNFVYTAMNSAGEQISEVLDCADEAEARRMLAERGLFVTRLEAGRRTAGSGAGRARLKLPWRRSYNHELMVFSRQMAMMLQAGAPMVPAMRAIIEQPARAEWRRVLTQLADEVEGGATLCAAMGQQPKYFSGMVRSIVGAGESTGAIFESFQRLGEMLTSSQRTRNTVTAALIYPALLCMMSGGVVLTLAFFVLPRFADLFEMLDTELPFITRCLLDWAAWMKETWAAALGVPLLLAIGAVFWLRSEGGQRIMDRVIMRIPGIGRAVSGVLLAKLLGTWGALLRSNVPLLDAIKQTRTLTRNAAIKQLNADVIDAVTAGREMHSVLRASRLVPATIGAAIATGEQYGKLGDSLVFVADWLQEQNDSLIGTLTRMFEPLILVMLGVVVGGVSIALFLPLFEIATAA